MLQLYFGLEGGREHTLEEIGNMLGVTRERIRQLRDRALKRLREGEMGEALASLRRRVSLPTRRPARGTLPRGGVPFAFPRTHSRTPALPHSRTLALSHSRPC